MLRIRKRQQQTLLEREAVLAEKHARQAEQALKDRQALVAHYEHSVLGDRAQKYVDTFVFSQCHGITTLFAPRRLSDDPSNVEDLNRLVESNKSYIEKVRFQQILFACIVLLI